MLSEQVADACCCMRILRHHVEITTTSCSWKLVAKAKVIDLLAKLRDDWWLGAAIERLILLPRFAYETTVLLEIAQLDCIEEIERVGLHLGEDGKMVGRVEEHASHYLCKDMLGGTGDACIIKEVTIAIVLKREDAVREVANHRYLIESGLGLEEFDAAQDAAILILPTTTCGK